MIYPIQREDVDIFKPVVRRGHFELTTGRHSETYINKDAIPLFPEIFDLVIERFSTALHNIENNYDCIVSPAVAGIPFGSPLAYRKHKLFVYPEKKDNKMVFREVLRQGLKGKKVIVVEDVVTTGGSIIKTIEACEEAGAEVIGSICIWLRAKEAPEGTKLLYAVVHEEVESFEPHECPTCEEDLIPLTHPKTGQQLHNPHAREVNPCPLCAMGHKPTIPIVGKPPRSL